MEHHKLETIVFLGLNYALRKELSQIVTPEKFNK